MALDGEIKAILPLPFAGLMSDQRMEFVNRRLKQLRYWTAELGVPEGLNVFMVLSAAALLDGGAWRAGRAECVYGAFVPGIAGNTAPALNR